MKMQSNGPIGYFKLPMVILWMLGAGIFLCGCAMLGGTNTPQDPFTSDTSEPPAIVGNTETPMPQDATLTVPGATPSAAGADQPVSNPAAVPSGTSLVTAEPPDLNRPHITGHVTDTRGEPVIEAILMITRGTAEYPERTFLTDEHGSYIITVPQGTFTVVANGEGFRTAEKEVVVGAGAAILDFELESE